MTPTLFPRIPVRTPEGQSAAVHADPGIELHPHFGRWLLRHRYASNGSTPGARPDPPGVSS